MKKTFCGRTVCYRWSLTSGPVGHCYFFVASTLHWGVVKSTRNCDRGSMSSSSPTIDLHSSYTVKHLWKLWVVARLSLKLLWEIQWVSMYMFARAPNSTEGLVWYSKMPTCNTLPNPVKRLCTPAGVSGFKTNHSLCVTTAIPLRSRWAIVNLYNK